METAVLRWTCFVITHHAGLTFSSSFDADIAVRSLQLLSLCFKCDLNNQESVVSIAGLVTRLTDDQKYGMIEAIAHLIHRDYGAIVKDFVKLGFIPDGVNLEPILPVLAKVFDQALEGGGARNINFQELAADLAQITFDYPFRIPPYFALIIRAIGVLEGIALVGNPEFAIIDEAYPYIAQVCFLI